MKVEIAPASSLPTLVVISVIDRGSFVIYTEECRASLRVTVTGTHSVILPHDSILVEKYQMMTPYKKLSGRKVQFSINHFTAYMHYV